MKYAYRIVAYIMSGILILCAPNFAVFAKHVNHESNDLNKDIFTEKSHEDSISDNIVSLVNMSFDVSMQTSEPDTNEQNKVSDMSELIRTETTTDSDTTKAITVSDSDILTAANQTQDVLIYTLNDNQVTIVDCQKSATTSQVEEAINALLQKGFTIVSIGESAFQNCTLLTTFPFPEGLRSIGKMAFWNTSLQKITIPATLEYCDRIGKSGYGTAQPTGPFGNTPSLSEVEFASDTTDIAAGVLCGVDSVKILKIPEGVVNIGHNAFRNMGSITVTLPNTLQSIGSEAFWETKISSITLPASLSYCDTFYIQGYAGDQAGPFGTIDHVRFEDGITKVPDNIFLRNNVTSVELPESVTSIGDYSFFGTDLHSIILPDQVETIGKSAFEDSDQLTDITLSDSLTSIGEKAFWGTSLINVLLPASLTSCERATVLTPVVIPNGGLGPFANIDTLSQVTFAEGTEIVTNYVLYGASHLQYDSWPIPPIEVILPDSVIEIGTGAFANIRSLTIELPNQLEIIGTIAFSNTGLQNITLPDSLKIISNYAFSDTFLTVIELPPSLEIIDNFAFEGTDLSRIDLPNSLVKLGSGAFSKTNISTVTLPVSLSNASWEISPFNGMSYLKEVTFADGTTTIPSGILRNCESVNTVIIPDSVTTIGSYAFYYTGITSVTLPDHLETIEERAFCGSKLTGIDFPDTLKSIGINAFYNTSIRSIKLPASLTSYGSIYVEKYGYGGPFQRILTLTEVEFAEGTTIIPEYALAGVENVTQIILPSTVKEIQDSAFRNMKSLEGIYIPTGVTYIGEEAFAESNRFLTFAGEFESYAEQYAIDHGILFQSIYDIFITLQTNETTNTREIYVYGDAPYGEDVLIYDGDTLIGTIETKPNRKYSGIVRLVEGYGIHNLQAVSIDRAGEVISTGYSVAYDAALPQLLEFDLYHNGQAVDMTTQGGIREVLYFNQDKEFSFRIKTSNPNQIKRLLVCDEKDGMIKSLIAEYNAENDIFIAAGSFYDGASDEMYAPSEFFLLYLPDSVSVPEDELDDLQYYKFLGHSTISYLSTVSQTGMVYELFPDQPIEDVKLTVYYQDAKTGKAVIWNGAVYDQMNPQYSDEKGRFYWKLKEGIWQVEAQKEGYETLVSDWQTIPPKLNEISLVMRSIANPRMQVAHIYSSRIHIEFDHYVQINTVAPGSVIISSEGKEVEISSIRPLQQREYQDIPIAKEFDIYLKETIRKGVNYTISVNGEITGYNDKPAMPDSITEQQRAYLTDITFSDRLIHRGGEYVLAVTLIPGTGVSDYELLVTSSQPEIVSIKSISEISESGKVSIVLQGNLVGTADITVGAKGTNIEKTFTVTVGGEEDEEDILLGDVNEDGEINIFDIIAIRNYIFGISDFDDYTFRCADTTGDGDINIFDIIAIRDHIFGVKMLSNSY
jgi:hypothetical protein